MADDLVGLIGSAVKASKKLGKLGHLFHHGGNRTPSSSMPVPTVEQVHAELPADASSDDLASSLSDVGEGPQQVPVPEESLQATDLGGTGEGILAPSQEPQLPPFASPSPVGHAMHKVPSPAVNNNVAPASGKLERLLMQQLMQKGYLGGAPPIPNPNSIDLTRASIGPAPNPTSIGPSNPLGNATSIGPVANLTPLGFMNK